MVRYPMHCDIKYVKVMLRGSMDYIKGDIKVIKLNFAQYKNPEVKFDLDYIKTYLNEIKNEFPEYKLDIRVCYSIANYSELDEDKCKKLEIIDNYLRSIGSELYIGTEEDDSKEFGFRQTVQANRKIEEVASKIKQATDNGEPLSTFEKFMLVYEYVTEYLYNKENEKEDGDISRHWVPVTSGDKIVCVGYASLLEEICRRVFDPNELKVFENEVDIYTAKSLVGRHASNIILIKDEKYGINGVFYVDSCWDAKSKNNKDKGFSYCCIPLGDILCYKKAVLAVDNFHENIADEIGEFIGAKKDWYGDIKKTGEEILLETIFGIGGFEDDDLKPSFTQFVKHLDNLPHNEPIPVEAFVNAFKIIGKREGLEGKDLKEYVKNRLVKSVEKTNRLFKVQQCRSCFATTSIEDIEKGIINKRK